MSDSKVVTGLVRFSYAHVFEPNAVQEGQEPKYSVSLIIPKDDTATIKKIKKAIKFVADNNRAKWDNKDPNKLKNFKWPLRDGDEEKEDDEVYADAYFVNATSKSKPGIVDKDLNPIIDKTEFYSGCHGRASINFYAFNVNGNKGIACGLNNVQKLKEGEQLGGGSKAEDDFGDPLDDDLLA